MTLTLFVDNHDFLLNAVRNPDTADRLKKHLANHAENPPVSVLTIEQGAIVRTEQIGEPT